MGALVRAHWFGESENNSKPECSHGFPARCHTHHDLPRAFPFLLTFLPASDNAISFDATSSLCMAISMYSIHIVPSLWQLYSVSLDICTSVVLPWFRAEPRFGPEPSRTGPRSGPRFRVGAELDPKSGSRFGGAPEPW